MNTDYTTNIEEALCSTWPVDPSDSDGMMSDSGEEVEASTTEGQVHQGGVRTTESEVPEGASEIEVDENDTGAVLHSVGATKAAVVSGLWYYAKTATKHVVVDGMLEEVENHAGRIDALKTLAKLHFDKQFRTVKRNKKLNVVLIRDGQ